MTAREVFNDLDNTQGYASWLSTGDPELEELEFVGAVGVVVRPGQNGHQQFYHSSFIVGSGLELIRNKEAFLEGHSAIQEEFADPGIRTFGIIKELYADKIMRRTCVALGRAHLSLIGAYTLFRSEVGSQYSRYLEVSSALIRQSTSAASESGIIKRDYDLARSFRGRLFRRQPLEPEQYGQLIAQALLLGLLPKPEDVIGD